MLTGKITRILRELAELKDSDEAHLLFGQDMELMHLLFDKAHLMSRIDAALGLLKLVGELNDDGSLRWYSTGMKSDYF